MVLPLLTGQMQQIIADDMLHRDVGTPLLVAIDGRSASGKTTLVNALAEQFHTSVVHMDDFFLPVELRTPERFAMPGGNVHFERFQEEFLLISMVCSLWKGRTVPCHDLENIIIVPYLWISPLKNSFAESKNAMVWSNADNS